MAGRRSTESGAMPCGQLRYTRTHARGPRAARAASAARLGAREGSNTGYTTRTTSRALRKPAAPAASKHAALSPASLWLSPPYTAAQRRNSGRCRP